MTVTTNEISASQTIQNVPVAPLAPPKIEDRVNAMSARFRFDDLYSGIDSPQLELDIQKLEQKFVAFDANFRGRLATRLGDSLDARIEMERLFSKIDLFLSLKNLCDVADEPLQSKKSNFDERFAAVSARHSAFFKIQVGEIDDASLQLLIETDKRVAFHQPLISQIRLQAKHLLPEPIEVTLRKRAPYSASTVMGEYYQRRVSEIRFTLPDESGDPSLAKVLSEAEILQILTQSIDRETRARALTAYNTGLKGEIVTLYSATLNAVIGEKSVDDADRKFSNPMASENLSNQVSPEVVDALHEAVRTKGAELTKRYYSLLSKRLGVEKLLWSDRTARLGKVETIIPWDEAVQTVTEAYNSFSPTLSDLFQKMVKEGWIDAPIYTNKSTGACCASGVLPESLGERSYIFMNYLGSPKDVMTLAHESGHGVHGLLAGVAQGALMSSAPTAYCETASIFSEMVTSDFLLRKITNPEERLCLLMDKGLSFLAKVVRQISFSEFEQRIHAERKNGKLEAEQFCQTWKDVTEVFYGKDGEVFEFKEMENLWSTIPHFMSPFYVYSYAFGELLTQSLYAVKDQMGEAFEPLYLDLLRAGGTKDVVELLAPFNLDPRDPQFWVHGMEASFQKWIEEAEALHEQLPARDVVSS